MHETAKPTIRDIARLAGVSRSTVSLVINGDPRITAATRGRVLEVIESAGYQPNTMARGLARRRANAAAVILPVTGSHVLADVYFAEAISGISDVLSEAGYRLVIEMANARFLEHATHRRLLRQGAADGMLLLGTIKEDAYVRELIELRTPLVLVNTRMPGASAVYADNRSGAREMVGHLASLGHRRIAFIGGLENTTVGEDRSLGFLDGLAEAGIALEDDLRLWGNFSESSGAEAARALLVRRPRPTALMAANDMMALGALRVAQEEFGLHVPGDLTVVGADDIRLTTYVRPRLTTLSQPIYDIGRMATQLLLEIFELGDSEPVERVVPTRLIARESSGPPPAPRT